jgi:hypothetical protein
VRIAVGLLPYISIASVWLAELANAIPTFLTRKGIISPKLQLLSGHAEEKSLAIYRDLALADVSGEYEQAM